MQAFIPHALPTFSRSLACKSTTTMCAPPEPAVEPFYPNTRRFQAPYVEITENSITLDMAEVPLPPAQGADPQAPDPALYQDLKKNIDSVAPFIEVTPPSSYVAVSMGRVADSPALLDPAEFPDPSTYNKFFGSDGRPLFAAPFIEVVDQPGGVGVEMSEVVADAPTSSVDPAKFSSYMHIGSALNKAPFITIGDDVVKVAMCDVDGDTMLEDDAAGKKMSFRPKGGMHSAPVITFPDGNDGFNIEYKTISGYDCGLNCAPVIEFDGQIGINLSMSPIEGDYESVCITAAENRASKAYSSSWKPASSLSKKWV